jgi:uncharacterized LabA/DUF88 family protein
MGNVQNKTVVYIDAANIILSAKNIELDLNIFKLIKKIKDKYRSEKIIYFTGKFPSMKDFFVELKKIDVDIVFKEIYNENNKQKANCDVEISHKFTYDIDHGLVNNVILCSGDGDFAHILDFANSKKYSGESYCN